MVLLRVATGSRGGIRTPDRVVNSHLLCRLSYPGIFKLICHRLALTIKIIEVKDLRGCEPVFLSSLCKSVADYFS